MTLMDQQVLDDPIGVCVDLIMPRGPGLNPAEVTKVVVRVAGGRAKRRKLAKALLDNPAVLSNGRSPALRAVGDLLIALRAAGAVGIAAPACAECGKDLRTLQRYGQDWYCSVCTPARHPCASCGKTGRVATRNRQGQPLCLRCKPQREHELETLIGTIQGIDPNLPLDVIHAAIAAAIPAPGRRYLLAWAIEDQPDLLTGGGAHAPIPAVLRLIDNLCVAGATGIVRPACPGCQRVIRLTKMRGGVRLCRNCVAKSRAEPCGRCRVIREACARRIRATPVSQLLPTR